MCIFVSESDEVFGTLRMYGAAACCNSRVHGRNVVLWPPLSNKHPISLPTREVCAAGGFGADRRKAGELVGPRRHQGRLLAPSKGSLAACLASKHVSMSQPWWGLFVALRSEVLRIVGSSAAAIEFVDNLCAPRCATASYCCKVCAPLLL